MVDQTRSRLVRLSMVFAVLMTFGNLLSLMGHGDFVLAQGDACSTSGPDSGAYQVRLCILSPGQGAELNGDITVTATLETVSGTAPEVEWFQFYFTPANREESAAVLRDYIEPFTFTLPTERWTDGEYRLEVSATFDDDFVTKMTGVGVSLSNGVARMPVGTGRWVPKSVDGNGPVTVAAVGDGASGMPDTYAVADLIEGWDPDMLLYLGDVYNVGSYTEFMNYYDPTLGQMKDITNPIPGDHEGGRQFTGYQDYWDSNLHYYTATAGSWQLIGIDSTDRSGQFEPGTLQFQWLSTQLEKHQSACTLVFMHNPRWGLHKNYEYEKLDPLWKLFADEGVDLVVTGHEHNYQRWMPLDRDGNPSTGGTTEIIAGTGGHKTIPFYTSDDRVVAQFRTHGALKLELREGEAGFAFYDLEGNVLDSGTVPCVDEPADEDEIDASTPVPDPALAESGVIANTGGLGALCLAAPALDAETISLLPDGTRVELRGALEGEWWPVRCDGQDGYVYVDLLLVDDGGAGGIPGELAWDSRSRLP